MKINLIHHAINDNNKQIKNIINKIINDFENNITTMLIVSNKKEADEQMNKLIDYFLNKKIEIYFSEKNHVIYNLETLIFIEYPKNISNTIKEELYNIEIENRIPNKKEAIYYKKIKNIYITNIGNICNLNEINKCLKYFCGTLENINEFVYFTFGKEHGLKSFYILENMLNQNNVTLEEITPEKISMTYEEYMRMHIPNDFFYKTEVEGKLLDNFKEIIENRKKSGD